MKSFPSDFGGVGPGPVWVPSKSASSRALGPDWFRPELFPNVARACDVVLRSIVILQTHGYIIVLNYHKLSTWTAMRFSLPVKLDW